MTYLLSAPAHPDAHDERNTQPRSDALNAENEVLFGTAAARAQPQNVGRSRSPSQPRRGQQRLKRYECLERALMAREMERL